MTVIAPDSPIPSSGSEANEFHRQRLQILLLLTTKTPKNNSNIGQVKNIDSVLEKSIEGTGEVAENTVDELTHDVNVYRRAVVPDKKGNLVEGKGTIYRENKTGPIQDSDLYDRKGKEDPRGVGGDLDINV